MGVPCFKSSECIQLPPIFTIVPKFDSFNDESIEHNVKMTKIPTNFSSKWSKWLRKPSIFTIAPKFDSFKDEFNGPSVKMTKILTENSLLKRVVLKKSCSARGGSQP